MIYVLIVFYTINRQVYYEQLDQPTYSECIRAKQLWLHEAAKLKLSEPEAYCVVRK